MRSMHCRALLRVLAEQRLLTSQNETSAVLRRAIAPECKGVSSFLSRQVDSGADRCSQWLPAMASVGECGNSRNSSSQPLFAMWGAAFLAGGVALAVSGSDGVVSAEGAELPAASPMGKRPESKLAKPTFFLSGWFLSILLNYLIWMPGAFQFTSWSCRRVHYFFAQLHEETMKIPISMANYDCANSDGIIAFCQ